MSKRKFENGDEVSFTSNTPTTIKRRFIGNKLTITSYYGESKYIINGRNCYGDSVESRFLILEKGKKGKNCIDNLRTSLDRKLLQIKDLEKVVSEINAKLEFASVNGFDDFDENQYKAYKMLTMIEDKSLSKIEKARLISDMIK